MDSLKQGHRCPIMHLRQRSSLIGLGRYTYCFKRKLKKLLEKYKAMLDQHKVENTFKVGDKFWLLLNKERL
jgi:hypothetical protein